MLLAGDVGGTKTLLALFEEAGDGLRAVREATFSSREHTSLEEILGRFLASGPRPVLAAACFCVAGPVLDGRSQITNLPWLLDEAALAQALQVPRVKLLNDLEAAAHGMLFLAPADMCVLQAGRRRVGNIAVIAAGTGLGEALLVWDGTAYLAIASEGGHADFAPRNELQIELLRFLQKAFGHVSTERVLSGPGLLNIYHFLHATGATPEPAWLRERMEREDPSAVISEVGIAGQEPLCRQALDLFVSIYGAAAGNLALKGLALGGVFIGGGIAPKILPKLQEGIFLAAFRDKGRFAELLAFIPVVLALSPRAPLIGAAHRAGHLAREALARASAIGPPPG